MNIVQAVILAIIEGITEFLPVSSTGHMVVTSTLMGIAHHDFTKLYTVAIQLGAIFSVVILYWKRFFQSFNFYLKLFIGFIPAAFIGFIYSKEIDALLENAYVVAIMLIVGGIIFLFMDNWFKQEKRILENHPTMQQSFKIGIFQCIAMIPGVSRSAATIIGGLSQKLSRKAAAEFSFFLAVPTMFAATLKKLFDYYEADHLSFSSNEMLVLFLGNIVAFIVALLAIRTFIGFLSRNGFKFFGYYRIFAGLLILILLFAGYQINL